MTTTVTADSLYQETLPRRDDEIEEKKCQTTMNCLRVQKPHTLHRIINATWNNATQQPNYFVRQFKQWRDEIYNYEETTGTTFSDAFKTTMFINRLRGEVRAHLLLNKDMNKSDFNKAAKAVNDDYKNVYIENDYTTNTNAFKGKKGKRKRKLQPQKTRQNHRLQPIQQRKRKGKYQSRPH
eukprot:3070202-Amphidinium_carterae.1